MSDTYITRTAGDAGATIYTDDATGAEVARATYDLDAKAHQPQFRLETKGILLSAAGMLTPAYFSLQALEYVVLAALIETKAAKVQGDKRVALVDGFMAEVRALMDPYHGKPGDLPGDKDFNLPGDAWALYMDSDMTAAEAVAYHREHGAWTFWNEKSQRDRVDVRA